MLSTRNMRLALLISFLWHLFWMSFVSIFFLPSGLKLRQYTSVHFLGSILRDSLFIEKIPNASKKPFGEIPSELGHKKQSHFAQPLGAGAGLNEKPYVSLLVERQVLNLDDFIEVDNPKEGASALASFVITNSSKQREIIFQPPFPEYPKWLSSQEFRASSAVFKIYISADGLVEQVINVQASGNPEIDAALSRYIRKLHFTPCLGRQGQWQTVKIDLDFTGSTPLTINSQASRGSE